MTTEASPHTMPSIVSAERKRFRIRACQPCVMSSLRNIPLRESNSLQNYDVAGSGLHVHGHTAAAYFSSYFFTPHGSLHRDRMFERDCARACTGTQVEG